MVSTSLVECLDRTVDEFYVVGVPAEDPLGLKGHHGIKQCLGVPI